jgi:methylglutaconyl-CoA hydratase
MSAPVEATRAGAVLVLKLNRPRRRNALSRALVRALRETVRAADGDAGVRCVVLTGAPPAFCAGLDLEEVAATRSEEDAYDTSGLLALYDAVEGLQKPVIAAVNGAALAGGAALVCACDFAVFAASATIGFPGIQRGLLAPIVMPYLVRAVGERMARYLLLTGRSLDARRALEVGLAAEVVEDGDVLGHARRTAAVMARFPADTVGQTKEILGRLGAREAGVRDPAVRAWMSSVPLTEAARAALKRFLDG